MQKVEARSSFSKRLLPGASHADQAYLHQNLSSEYGAKARAAHELFLRSHGWKNRAKRRRLLKYMKENSRLADKHDRLGTYHNTKSEALGDRDIKSTGNRLRDWWKRSNIDDKKGHPDLDQDYINNQHHENDYNDDGHSAPIHEPAPAAAQRVSPNHKAPPTKPEQDSPRPSPNQHDDDAGDSAGERHPQSREQYIRDAIDHHDEQASLHEHHMLNAQNVMAQHPESSAKYKAAAKQSQFHQAQYEHHLDKAQAHQNNLDKLKGSNGFAHHGDTPNPAEPSDYAQEHQNAYDVLSQHHDDLVKHAKGLQGAERQQADKHIEAVRKSMQAHARAAGSVKPNPASAQTESVTATPKETRSNTFFKGMTPEQRDGYAHHFPDSPLSTAHAGNTAFEDHSHEDMQNYHAGMAKHNMEQADNLDKKAAENGPPTFDKAQATHHIQNLHTATHEFNVAKNNGQHDLAAKHLQRMQDSINGAKAAGVSDKVVEGQAKGAQANSARRLAAQAKRERAVQATQTAAWHGAKKYNLGTSPDKPSPDPVQPTNPQEEEKPNFPKNPKRPNGKPLGQPQKFAAPPKPSKPTHIKPEKPSKTSSGKPQEPQMPPKPREITL